MKTLEALLEENKATVTNEGSTDKDGNYVPLVMITLDSLENLINEVISQRAGEPVAYFIKDIGREKPDVINLDTYKRMSLLPSEAETFTPLFLAADPSVIDYVKQLHKKLGFLYDKYENGDTCHDDDDSYVGNAVNLFSDEDAEIVNLLTTPPDSIKHLLT